MIGVSLWQRQCWPRHFRYPHVVHRTIDSPPTLGVRGSRRLRRLGAYTYRCSVVPTGSLRLFRR